MSAATPLLFRDGRRGGRPGPDTNPCSPCVAHLRGRAVACDGSVPGTASGPRRTSCMSAMATARTTGVHAGSGRTGGDWNLSGRPTRPWTPAWPLTPAQPRVPDTNRPDGRRSGSSGRSIRRLLWLVTTSSAATAVDHAISRPTTKQRSPRHGGRPEADFGSPPASPPAGPLAAVADTGRPAAFVADRDQGSNSNLRPRKGYRQRGGLLPARAGPEPAIQDCRSVVLVDQEDADDDP